MPAPPGYEVEQKLVSLCVRVTVWPVQSGPLKSSTLALGMETEAHEGPFDRVAAEKLKQPRVV